jgi:hypothetical protein
MRVTLDKGPPMQSTQMPKIQQEIDPHDVFAIEQALAAHAHRAPPLVHDPAAPPAAPQAPDEQTVVQTQVAPEISIDTPTLQVDATYRAPAAGEMQLEDVRPGDLKPLGERPSAKWTKGVLMALLGLCGAIAAAAWQHYGDQAKATALGWVLRKSRPLRSKRARRWFRPQQTRPRRPRHRRSSPHPQPLSPPPLPPMQRSCSRWHRISPR